LMDTGIQLSRIHFKTQSGTLCTGNTTRLYKTKMESSQSSKR
jgi:hypothetical protein